MGVFKTVLYITLLMPAPAILLAHAVGSQQSERNLLLWNDCSTGQEYRASFLYAEKDDVYLEDTQGKLIVIALQHLTPDNLAFVKKQQEHIHRINQTNPFRQNIFVQYSGFLGYCLCLLVSFALYLILTRWMFTKITGWKRYIIVGSIGMCIAHVFSISQTTTITIDEAFAPFQSFIKTRKDNTYFYVESNGIPQHQMMVGIKSWQQQVPIPQNYSGSNAWSIPLKPTFSANPVSTKTSLYTGAIALAVNGIPIFNALNNRGDDAFLYGELDNWGGHCGRADDYHYHIAPLHLQAIVGANKPIAYALDGYAIYGATEPDAKQMQPLDTYNGHTGSDGVYHYHGTSTYPYTCGGMRGNVTVQNDQIIPQPRANPIRPALTPLNGATITNFTTTATSAYSLEYTLNNQKYYVNYTWTATGLYTFTFIDANGGKRTETYQGKPTGIRMTNDPILSIHTNPNPFTDIVTLEFFLTKSSTNVVWYITDVTGREIMRQSRNELQAGNHNIVWDGRIHEGSVLPAGVYYVRVFCNGQQWGETTIVKR